MVEEVSWAKKQDNEIFSITAYHFHSQLLLVDCLLILSHEDLKSPVGFQVRSFLLKEVAKPRSKAYKSLMLNEMILNSKRVGHAQDRLYCKDRR